MSFFSKLNIIVSKITSVSKSGLSCNIEEEKVNDVCSVEIETSDKTRFYISERNGELVVVSSDFDSYNIKIKNGVLTIKPINE